MSSLRKLRKLAREMELKKIGTSEACALHGCEECRSDEKRQQLARQLVAMGRATGGAAAVACNECEARWRVEFKADDQGMALVVFTGLQSAPAPRAQSN